MAFSTWVGSTSVFHKPAGDHRFHLDLLAQGPAQQVGHVADDPAQIHRARIQRLAAGEGEQLAGQARAARHRAHRVLQPLAQLGIGLAPRPTPPPDRDWR